MYRLEKIRYNRYRLKRGGHSAASKVTNNNTKEIKNEKNFKRNHDSPSRKRKLRI